MPKGQRLDTRKKLRETMDRLALATAEQLELLPAQKFDEKLAGFATLTKYITAVNREPDQPEGADLGEFRKRLDRFSVVRGDRTGDAGDGDPDGERAGETDDDSGADFGGSFDGDVAPTTDPDLDKRSA